MTVEDGILNFLISVAANKVSPYCELSRLRWFKTPVGTVTLLTLFTWAAAAFSCYIAFLYPREYRVEPWPTQMASLAFLFCAFVMTYALRQMYKMNTYFDRRMRECSSN